MESAGSSSGLDKLVVTVQGCPCRLAGRPRAQEEEGCCLGLLVAEVRASPARAVTIMTEAAQVFGASLFAMRPSTQLDSSGEIDAQEKVIAASGLS